MDDDKKTSHRKQKSRKTDAYKCISALCELQRKLIQINEINQPDELDLAEIIELLTSNLNEDDVNNLLKLYRISELEY